MTFNAREPGLDRDALELALASAGEQLELLPDGRVLRGLENSKLARRMSTAASRAGLRPRLMRVFNTAVHLTVHYSRLVDEVSLGQLAHEAGLGPGAARKLGADLAELVTAGVLLYRPGRGRGRMSTIGIPARFASDVLLRLQREGRWTPPVTDQPRGDNIDNATPEPSVSTGGPDVVDQPEDDLHADLRRPDSAAHEGHNVPQNSPGRGGVSERAPSSYVPKAPLPPSSAPAANTASSPQTRGAATPHDNLDNAGDNVRRVSPADLDWILNRLPQQLRTTPGSRGRQRQVASLCTALAEEFRRKEILDRITHALPAVVDSAAGFLAYRVSRLMDCAESPRHRRLRDQALQEASRVAAQESSATRDAAADWQATVLAELSPALLAAMAELSLATVWRRPTAALVDTPNPTGLAHTVSSMLREAVAGVEPSVSTRGEGVVREAALRLLADAGLEPKELSSDAVDAVVQAPTLAAAVVALCRPDQRNNATDTVLTLPPDPRPGPAAEELSCVACGEEDDTVQQRPELPSGSAVCTACYTAAVDDNLVVEHEVVETDDEVVDRQPWWATIHDDDEGDLDDEEVA
ncbi:hypothetical protein [Kutzneria buriramensis]|uniref:hypothetical protein n=1 Tax=Kutzneria buriramensis TaxID=1045776 RepID=UPI000E2278EE|nr:hypothetical protein [Kutzneria buriramensis]